MRPLREHCVCALQDCQFSSGRLDHELAASVPSLSFEQRQHLISHYGFLARDVVDLGRKEGLLTPLIDGEPYLKAEVAFACRFVSLAVMFAFSLHSPLIYLIAHYISHSFLLRLHCLNLCIFYLYLSFSLCR